MSRTECPESGLKRKKVYESTYVETIGKNYTENHTTILDDEFIIQSRNKIRYIKTSLIKLDGSSRGES